MRLRHGLDIRLCVVAEGLRYRLNSRYAARPICPATDRPAPANPGAGAKRARLGGHDPIARSGEDGAPLGLRLAPSADRRRCVPPLAGRWRGPGCGRERWRAPPHPDPLPRGGEGEGRRARACALPYSSPCSSASSAARRSAISSGWLRLMR